MLSIPSLNSGKFNQFLRGARMPSFMGVRAFLPLPPTIASTVGTIHPPFVFAPVYTILPLHFK
jgi:hypothetical protein